MVGKGINKACISLTCHEKCVMCITGWVLLWLEQRIKIPKWTFHKVVCRHLSKPENKIIVIIINSYSFNQWTIFLLLNYLMVLWIKSVADGNASLGFPKGILHSSAIFKNSVWASSGHEQKKFRFRNEDPEIHASLSSFFLRIFSSFERISSQDILVFPFSANHSVNHAINPRNVEVKEASRFRHVKAN